jgi:uncharacterized protein (DUF362 family)
MYKVFVEPYKKESVFEDIERVLNKEFFLDQRLSEVKNVFIKPNLVSDIPEYVQNGSNTSTIVIEGVLRYLSKYHVNVFLGESETGTKVKGRKFDSAIEAMGILELKKKYDLTVVNLTNDEQVEVEIPGAIFLKKVKLSKIFLGCDLIINLPKLKTHKYGTITCSLKNMFGAIPDPLRIVYHENIHQVLADLNRLFDGKMFVLTDGIVCMDGQGPLYGNARSLNILMFSDDPLANDYVASRIMKIPQQEVKHIQLTSAWKGFDESMVEVHSFKPIDQIVNAPFTRANKNWFVKLEGKLMQHPFFVKIIFNDFFRRNVTKKIRFITDRLRGGSYRWHE